MLKLIGNVLFWASIVIAISGIAYYYWIGTPDMLAVYVAAGIMVLAGVPSSLWATTKSLLSSFAADLRPGSSSK
jgi:hypothetical protein